MTRISLLLCSALLSSSFLGTAIAGPTGYPSYRGTQCAESKFQTPRYNQTLPYRHYEDRRRYNAAPCQNQTLTQHPYLLKTVVVRKKRVPYYSYDCRGRRQCQKVLVVTYKDIYSDGSCRVYERRS